MEIIKTIRSKPILLGIPLVGICVWAGIPWIVISVSKHAPGSIAAAGQIGDTFGVVNALFSLVAVLSVSITLYLQYAQLKQTESEIKASEGARRRESLLQAMSTFGALTMEMANSSNASPVSRELMPVHDAIAQEILDLTDDPTVHGAVKRVQESTRARVETYYQSMADAGQSAVKATEDTKVADDDRSPILVGDVVREFSRLGLFKEDELRNEAGRLRAQLITGHIVTKKQLRGMIDDSSSRELLKTIYIEELKRDKKNPLDPMAIAAWIPPLFIHGHDQGVKNWIIGQIRQSREYREKHT